MTDVGPFGNGFQPGTEAPTRRADIDIIRRLRRLEKYLGVPSNSPLTPFGPSGIRARKAATTQFVPAATFVDVDFDTVVNQQGGWVITGTNQFVVPPGGGGTYVAACGVYWAGVLTFMLVSITVNNLSEVANYGWTNGSDRGFASGMINVVEGDTVRVRFYNLSGSAVNVTVFAADPTTPTVPFFEIWRVAPL